MDLSNKVVLVTGASRNLGKAIAIECARSGADIAVHYTKSEAEAGEVFRQALHAVGVDVEGGDLGALRAELLAQTMAAGIRLDNSAHIRRMTFVTDPVPLITSVPRIPQMMFRQPIDRAARPPSKSE